MRRFLRRWRFVIRLGALLIAERRLRTMETICSRFNQVNWYRGLPWERNRYRKLARAYNIARHRSIFAPWLPPAAPLKWGVHGQW